MKQVISGSYSIYANYCNYNILGWCNIKLKKPFSKICSITRYKK